MAKSKSRDCLWSSLLHVTVTLVNSLRYGSMSVSESVMSSAVAGGHNEKTSIDLMVTSTFRNGDAFHQ